MSLEIFTQKDNRGISKKAEINGESAEFLWGFELRQGTATNAEFVYEGTRLSMIDEPLRQILSRLGYQKSSSVLYTTNSQVINSKTQIMRDWRYFPFGSVKFCKQFYFDLNESFLEGSTTEEEFNEIYEKTIRTTNTMLSDLGKCEWNDYTAISSGLADAMGKHISEFNADTLVARIMKRVREDICQ